MDLFLAEMAAGPTAAGEAPTDDDDPAAATIDGSVEFGSGHSSGGGWAIPLRGNGWRRGWWRVFEVYPPRRGVARTGTGKYSRAEEGARWEAALETIARGLDSVGFTPEDLYVLCLTLERLDDDQWARVDKRLFFGEGVHTRAGWMLAPVPEKWAEWPRLVHARGMLPHEATQSVLGGIWRNGRF